jgi:hypothetical protein
VSLLRHALCAFTGAVTGLAAVAVHRSAFPGGLLLALVTTFAVAWALRHSGRPRTAGSYAAGWLVVFGAVFAGRPEGDYAVVADLAGFALIVAALLLAIVGVVAVAGGRGPDRRRP